MPAFQSMQVSSCDHPPQAIRQAALVLLIQNDPGMVAALGGYDGVIRIQTSDEARMLSEPGRAELGLSTP